MRLVFSFTFSFYFIKNVTISVYQGIGQLRNPAFDSERLNVHSSRIAKPGPLVRFLLLAPYFLSPSQVYFNPQILILLNSLISSDTQIPRNISCPVSPIGSPLLHARSPQHFHGRMSPSPISSPRTASGSCTPLTAGTGSIPFRHMKQTSYMHEGLGNLPKPSCRPPYISGGATYHELNPEIFWGIRTGNHAFPGIVSDDNNVLGKQFGKPSQVDLSNGQSVFTDRVSQQLLRDHVRVNLALDVGPTSRFPGHYNGNLT